MTRESISYNVISPQDTASVTVYADAFSTRTSAAKRKRFKSLRELFAWLARAPVKNEEKRRVPLFARAQVDGPRLKENLVAPLLVVMDVDKSPVSITECSDRLELMGVGHVAHTTWSHGSGRRHSYRVFVDYVARDWEELEAITRQLFELAGIEATTESWKTPCFFVPAVHPDRASAYRLRSCLAPSTWVPAWREPQPAAPREPREPQDLDVEEVRSALEQVPNADREQWIEVGMALASSGHEDARSLWDEWASGQGYPDFDDEAQDVAWESFSQDEGGVSVATIFHRAREAGWRPPRPTAREDFAAVVAQPANDPRQPAPIRALLRAGRGGPRLEVNGNGQVLRNVGNAARCLSAMDLGLAHDDFADRVVMLGAGFERVAGHFPTIGRHLDDRAIHALLWSMREGGTPDLPSVEFSVDVVSRAALTLALSRAFNPVVEWLKSLEWDGTARLDGWLARHCGASEDALTSAAGRILLLGAVARAMEPGIKFDLMVVLEGSQGVGKSSLVAQLGGEYTLEGLPTSELRDKDVVTAMLGKWFVELDELDVARKADAQSLKSFLSRTSDRARLAYAKETRDFPRRCVFVGTTNDSAYLKDTTGNRRFLPAKVGRIDLAGVARDRDQLFAEAVAEWALDPTPGALVLPEALWESAAAQAEERRLVDPWEDAIERFLRQDDRRVLRGTEILEDGLCKPASQHRHDDLRRVKAAMTRLGWEHGTYRRRRDGQKSGNAEVVRGYKRPESVV